MKSMSVRQKNGENVWLGLSKKFFFLKSNLSNSSSIRSEIFNHAESVTDQTRGGLKNHGSGGKYRLYRCCVKKMSTQMDAYVHCSYTQVISHQATRCTISNQNPFFTRSLLILFRSQNTLMRDPYAKICHRDLMLVMRNV